MSILISEAEKHVVKLLNEQLDNGFVYHNLAHTQLVVKKAIELAELANIDDAQKEALVVSAWFHDTGFTKGIENHEEHSVEIATAFLKDQKCSEKTIQDIRALILATKMNYTPKNELEKLIRDADCAHIGSKNFNYVSELLRKEWELKHGKNLSDSEWIMENIAFLTQNHKFNSDLAASLWEKGKSKNLSQLLKTQKKQKEEKSKRKQKKEELAIKKLKVDLPERGIETMFRVALRNHITLSDIADTKANILLSVNAIIISVALSNLIPKLDNPSNHYLIYPTLIFMLFTVASIVLSVLATRPNITKGKFTKDDVANKKVNLLFFGNFHQMNLNDFEWAMSEMMKDRDYLYGSLTKDLYFLGLVLNRKYSLLRLTYTVFMIGIIISVLSFIIAFKYAGN